MCALLYNYKTVKPSASIIYKIPQYSESFMVFQCHVFLARLGRSRHHLGLRTPGQEGQGVEIGHLFVDGKTHYWGFLSESFAKDFGKILLSFGKNGDIYQHLIFWIFFGLFQWPRLDIGNGMNKPYVGALGDPKHSLSVLSLTLKHTWECLCAGTWIGGTWRSICS